jgi:hypothetical protein
MMALRKWEGAMSSEHRRQDPESEARAWNYAHNTRLKFERVYESARRAFAAGDNATALAKCRAALDLLAQENIYGDQQAVLQQTLRDRIACLSYLSGQHRL